MGTLFIIATPIGNLKDVTYRALEVMRSVNLILAEDTRSAKNLLNSYDIQKPEIWSLFEGNEERQIGSVLERLGKDENIALISESGTPIISDPGYKLVRETIKRGIKVESLPGPSAAIAALTVSGLPPDKFLFLGFLPKSSGKRLKLLENIALLNQFIKATVVIYESPHRLTKTLEELRQKFGDIDIVICRELTKIHEEVRREKISESLAHFEQTPPKGEFTILFHLEKSASA